MLIHLCAISPFQQITTLTCSTHNPGIISVVAIVTAPGTSTAVTQHALCPTAGHIVQPNCSCALPKLSTSSGPNGVSIPQLSTNNCGIIKVPNVITNSAPFSVVVDLHTSLICTTTSKQVYIKLAGRGWKCNTKACYC